MLDVFYGTGSVLVSELLQVKFKCAFSNIYGSEN